MSQRIRGYGGSHMPRPEEALEEILAPPLQQAFFPVPPALTPIRPSMQRRAAAPPGYAPSYALPPQYAPAPVASPNAPPARRHAKGPADSSVPVTFVAPIRDQQGAGEQAIVRWGDQQTLTVQPGSAVMTTGQLVRVNRHFPETWTISLFAALLDTGGTNLWDNAVSFNVTYGVGSSLVSFGQANPFGSSSGLPGYLLNFAGAVVVTPVVEDYLSITSPYRVIQKLVELPVKDLQIQATVINLDRTHGPIVMQVGAFAAPRVLQPSPMQAPPPFDDGSGGDGGQTTQWMGPGFSPEPTHYK